MVSGENRQLLSLLGIGCLFLIHYVDNDDDDVYEVVFQIIENTNSLIKPWKIIEKLNKN